MFYRAPGWRTVRLTAVFAILGVLAATVLAACQASTVPPSSSPNQQATVEPSGSASPESSPSSEPAKASGDVSWGPLAVADDPALESLDAGFGPGRLIVGSRCVTLRPDKGTFKTTLIWRSGQTSWDPGSRQIVFNDRDIGVIRLSAGDRIRLGGAVLADPDSPDQGAGQPTWILPPDPSCPSRRWVVHQVVVMPTQ